MSDSEEKRQPAPGNLGKAGSWRPLGMHLQANSCSTLQGGFESGQAWVAGLTEQFPRRCSLPKG